MSADPFAAPAGFTEPPEAVVPRIARLYSAVAIGWLVLSPGLLFLHLLFGGLLTSQVIDWQLRHERITVLPVLIFYGGALAQLAVPISFVVASRQLRLASPQHLTFWKLAPWTSWMAWPAVLLGLSLWFDLLRFSLES